EEPGAVWGEVLLGVVEDQQQPLAAQQPPDDPQRGGVHRSGGSQRLLLPRQPRAPVHRACDRLDEGGWIPPAGGHGVPLLAAAEPITLSGRGATQTLTRRVKQGISEWYVLEMLEKSRGGLERHTEEGFNIGKPPYGYLAEKIPHPVPARRAEGKTKSRLTP